MSKPLRVGMIGYGFMGKAHSNAYVKVPYFFDLKHRPVLAALCARNKEKAEAFAKNWGYESIETDWRKLIERKDIDLIDIGSPNNTHKEIAIAAAKAGKMIVCEKPLAMNTAEAEEMTDAIEKAGVANMVWFNYRRVPAISLRIKSSRKGALASRTTIERLTFKTGPLRTMFPKGARHCGASMLMWLDQV